MNRMATRSTGISKKAVSLARYRSMGLPNDFLRVKHSGGFPEISQPLLTTLPYEVVIRELVVPVKDFQVVFVLVFGLDWFAGVSAPVTNVYF
jgi:hypothetical protein